MTKTASLYTQGPESVYLQVEHIGAKWRLVVLGPGRSAASHEFNDHRALVEFQDSFEENLRARGFCLQASVERRSGADRRSNRRVAGERRRAE
jgi:hypothetical protein